MTIIPSITVTADTATPALAKIIERTDPAKLALVCRQPLETFVRVHLASNPRNKKGWPSTGFWEDASRATRAVAQDTGGVLILVEKLGVRQRYHGGVIAPVRAQALAIPISPVSYGHTPKDFPGLFLLVTKKGAYLCQRSLQTATGKNGKQLSGKKLGGNASRRQRADLNFLFKLVGSVTQDADHSIVPSADELNSVALSAMERSLN